VPKKSQKTRKNPGSNSTKKNNNKKMQEKVLKKKVPQNFPQSMINISPPKKKDLNQKTNSRTCFWSWL